MSCAGEASPRGQDHRLLSAPVAHGFILHAGYDYLLGLLISLFSLITFLSSFNTLHVIGLNCGCVSWHLPLLSQIVFNKQNFDLLKMRPSRFNLFGCYYCDSWWYQRMPGQIIQFFCFTDVSYLDKEAHRFYANSRLPTTLHGVGQRR